MVHKGKWLTAFCIALIWSAVNPHDYYIWFLEVLPALIAVVVIGATDERFPLTPLCSSLVLVHCIILMVGGHYTYAEVPLFDWLGGLFDWQRNNYDKLGHFAQGLVPAIVAREVLLRKHIVRQSTWVPFIVLSICLAISAFYELIEWGIALLSEQAADSFLGTQGYIWDTQSDMFWALLGALTSLCFLKKWHDEQLLKIELGAGTGRVD